MGRSTEKLFEIDWFKLVIDAQVYELIVSYAYNFKLGARGLRSICEKLFLDALYEMPSAESKEKKFFIDFEYAKEKLNNLEFNNWKKAS